MVVDERLALFMGRVDEDMKLRKSLMSGLM